jgi:hypothetical protein
LSKSETLKPSRCNSSILVFTRSSRTMGVSWRFPALFVVLVLMSTTQKVRAPAHCTIWNLGVSRLHVRLRFQVAGDCGVHGTENGRQRREKYLALVQDYCAAHAHVRNWTFPYFALFCYRVALC